MYTAISLLFLLEAVLSINAYEGWTPIVNPHYSHSSPWHSFNHPFAPVPARGNFVFPSEDLHFSNYPKVNLFTPNTIEETAETPGQIEEYNKALEEEHEEALKELNKLQHAYSPFEDSGLLDHENEHQVPPTSYVSVSLGAVGGHLKYGYRV